MQGRSKLLCWKDSAAQDVKALGNEEGCSMEQQKFGEDDKKCSPSDTVETPVESGSNSGKLGGAEYSENGQGRKCDAANLTVRTETEGFKVTQNAIKTLRDLKCKCSELEVEVQRAARAGRADEVFCASKLAEDMRNRAGDFLNHLTACDVGGNKSRAVHQESAELKLEP